MEMTSLLDMHLEDTPDLEIVPGGAQYEMKINSAKAVPSRSSDRTMIRLVLSINDHPNAQSVFENLVYPLPSDEEGTANLMKRRIRDALLAFGIDLTDQDMMTPEENEKGEPCFPQWEGLTAWAALKVEKNQNGDDENRIASWVKRR